MKKLYLLALILVLILSACSSVDEGAALVGDDAPNAQTTDAALSDSLIDSEQTEEILDSGNAAEALSQLLQKYPIEQISAAESLVPEELLNNALEKLNLSETLVMEMTANVLADMGEQGSLSETVETAYRTNGEAFELNSTVTSAYREATTVIASANTYIDGWYYSAQTLTMPVGGAPFTNRFKMQMTPEEFVESVLDAMGTDTAEFGSYVDLIRNAKTMLTGVLDDGSIAILGTDIDLSKLPDILESMEMMDEYRDLLTNDALEKLQTAVVFSEDGEMKEIYLDLPFTLQIDEEQSADLHLEIRLTVSSPATVEISAPSDSDSYEEVSPDELLGGIPATDELEDLFGDVLPEEE